ncbi:MAG TPA: hydroxymethylbilane synthase [Hyphomicrobiaceae bacterium]|nr:hydroxymethylbilane synthase [Hyphomicrobiaceae bacterium]
MAAPVEALASGARNLQAAPIRIGTRGSALALAQTHEVRARLMAAHGLPEQAFAIRIIKTTGDVIVDRPLAEAGGKALFTKEIEEALLANDIDLAVHSIKDMATVLPSGLAIAAALEREDPRDAFISVKFRSIDGMPAGSVVGTSSPRRQAQLKRLRPDIEVAGLRGNVETRLRKLGEGAADAVVLACAGLNRLGLAHRITMAIPIDVMLPAVAQGAIGIEIRSTDHRTAELVTPLNHEPTALCTTAERAFLARLEGSCRTPVAGHAGLQSGAIEFRGMTLSPDGRQCFIAKRNGPAHEAAAIGADAAEELLAQGALAFLGRSP